jgi:thiosulfate/3-mercaptopyruvate sulfurtransferase
MDPLVTTQWLADHLDDPDLVVLDCSVIHTADENDRLHFVSGRAEYETGHIPTAGFADLTAELCDPSSRFRFALPTPEQFCEAMGALGIGDDSRVVLYDGSITAWAARVWWMLRWVGFDRAAVLDGGLRAWTDEGRPLSTAPSMTTPQQLSPRLRPELIASRDETLAAIDDGAVCIVDAMPAEHYRGEMTMYQRTGHLPGAVNVPVRNLLDDSGRFRQLDELAVLHDTDRDARTITYCGGGIAASASALVMTLLGFDDVAVYTASLQEWAADETNPLVVNDA